MKFRIVLLVIAIGLLTGFSPVLSQDSLDKRTKDPTAASLMSVFVPGSGHVYAGETWTGIGVFGLTVGGPLVGVATTDFDGVIFSDENVNWTPLYLGMSVGFAAWLYGILDADNAARQYNQTLGLISYRIDLGQEVGGISALDVKMDPVVRQNRFDRPMYGMKLDINF